MAKKVKRKPIKRLQWASIWTASGGDEYLDLATTRTIARMLADDDRKNGLKVRIARVRITEVR